MPIRCRALAAVLAGAALPFAGCASGPDVTAQDHGLLLPTLRIDYSSWPAPERNEANESREERRRDHGLGFEVTGGSGSFDAGQGRYDLVSAQAWFYLATPATEALRGSLLLGLEYLSLDLSQRALGTDLDNAGNFGPLAGLDVGYAFLGDLQVYAHGTASAMLPATTSVRGEAGLRWRPAHAVELFGGYRWWRVQRNDLDLGGSGTDVDLHTDGIVVGMGLVF